MAAVTCRGNSAAGLGAGEVLVHAAGVPLQRRAACQAPLALLRVRQIGHSGKQSGEGLLARDRRARARARVAWHRSRGRACFSCLEHALLPRLRGWAHTAHACFGASRGRVARRTADALRAPRAPLDPLPLCRTRQAARRPLSRLLPPRLGCAPRLRRKPAGILRETEGGERAVVARDARRPRLLVGA